MSAFLLVASFAPPHPARSLQGIQRVCLQRPSWPSCARVFYSTCTAPVGPAAAMAGEKKRAAASKKKVKDESSGDESEASDSAADVGTGEALAEVPKDRIQLLNSKKVVDGGDYVLLWVQGSVRVQLNFALEHAIRRANELGKPVLAFFGVTDNYPEASERHYAFMLEGVAEAQRRFAERGVKLVVWKLSPELAAVELAKRACLLVVDRGYLRIQRLWREKVAGAVPCQVVQIEDNVVVPVEIASEKEEYAARTIRPKIMNKLRQYLVRGSGGLALGAGA
eukprot:tig00020952_g16502.t1